MVFSKQQVTKALLSFTLVAFLLVGTLGLSNFGMTMKMDMDGHMTMSDCFMPGMTTLCNMNPLDHIAMWQNMFTSLPTQSLVLTFLLLVLSILVVFTWVRQAHAPPKELTLSSRFYRRQEHVHPVNVLQELFSNGILNPKLY